MHNGEQFELSWRSNDEDKPIKTDVDYREALKEIDGV